LGRPKGYPKSGGRKKGYAIERVKRVVAAEVQAQTFDGREIVPPAVKIPRGANIDIVELAKAYAGAVLQSLFRLVLTSPSHSARVAAAAIILDRGYGRANQSLQISGEVKLRAVSDSELAVMAGRMVQHFHTIEGRADGIAGEFPPVATDGAGEVRPDFGGNGAQSPDSHNLASLP
jgi:hypothetical protein